MATKVPIGERMAKIEQKLEDVCSDLNEIKNAISGLDKKFASKLTEKIVYAMVGAILLGVLYLILEHVGIK